MITTQYGTLILLAECEAVVESSVIVVNNVNQIIIDTEFFGKCNGEFSIESATSGYMAVDIGKYSPAKNPLRFRTIQSIKVKEGATPSGTSYWWAEVLTAGAYLRITWYPEGSNAGSFKSNFFAKSYG
jgi:hypothetical protein